VEEQEGRATNQTILCDDHQKTVLLILLRSSRSVGSLDLVSTPVHVVDLFEVIGSFPEVIERTARAVVDGVVVLFSELDAR
jgi:hypothetical protein